MKKVNTGVHVIHCCSKCGCKYGDKDCPVVLGTVKQEYPCADCAKAMKDVKKYLRENLFIRLKTNKDYGGCSLEVALILEDDEISFDRVSLDELKE